jgi:hypothetical protein
MKLLLKSNGIIYTHIIRMVKTATYTFFASDRIGNDDPSKTQDEIQSANYFGLAAGNPFAGDYSDEQKQVQFAHGHVGMMASNVHGNGVGSAQVGDENSLILESEQGRNLSKLSLMQRPFATVPYLGKGSVDPILESQMLQGDNSKEKRTALPSEDTFMKHNLHPQSQTFMDDMKGKPMVESVAQAPRGGAATREVNTDYYQMKNAKL